LSLRLLCSIGASGATQNHCHVQIQNAGGCQKSLLLALDNSPFDRVWYGCFAAARRDAADYERLNRYRWNAFDSGGKLYARRSFPGGTILMHREIMQPPDGMVVDHINGNGLNNRRSNLRNCTPRQNEHNKPPRSGKFRFKGVYPRGDKWYAAIKHQGKTHYLGTFDNQTKAAQARDRKAHDLQGQFAYLNFPDAIRTEDQSP